MLGHCGKAQLEDSGESFKRIHLNLSECEPSVHVLWGHRGQLPLDVQSTTTRRDPVG